jgi:hypothetical protein
MPRSIRRPADLPWTHAVEPTEASAFVAGMNAGSAGAPLPPILALDRHAWRGVLRACPSPTGTLGDQWHAFVAEAAWYLPEEAREGEARKRVEHFASADEDLQKEAARARERDRKPALTPPSALPPAP